MTLELGGCRTESGVCPLVEARAGDRDLAKDMTIKQQKGGRELKWTNERVIHD
jgi:hypothetical protein